eukprot:5536348-Pleurochrysis_carterae.AAC.1
MSHQASPRLPPHPCSRHTYTLIRPRTRASSSSSSPAANRMCTQARLRAPSARATSRTAPTWAAPT